MSEVPLYRLWFLVWGTGSEYRLRSRAAMGHLQESVCCPGSTESAVVKYRIVKSCCGNCAGMVQHSMPNAHQMRPKCWSRAAFGSSLPCQTNKLTTKTEDSLPTTSTSGIMLNDYHSVANKGNDRFKGIIIWTHIGQSRPASGLDVQAKYFKTEEER